MPLSLQQIAAIVSLAGAVVIIALALYLVRSARAYEDKIEVKHRLYKMRGRYFFIAAAAALVLLIFSLRLLPYPQYQSAADKTVTVVGYQWGWLMAEGISKDKPDDFQGTNEITLPVGKQVRFIVTSRDVTHNFAIYNPAGAIVAQTQAMPRYRNELQHKFSEAGEYPIMCLEYCGMMHSNMLGMLHVK